ncbi:MAG: efflux RND transporter periplasmic adaptor subunit [Actinobacteria bacterium]|nr:efflux RND transporter periplasmic adaptor subunit [Actinomycetota bacterium]
MATHKRPPIPVIVLVVLLLAGGGFWWWWTASHPAEADSTLRASGTAEAREYQVSPALTGRVDEVKVAEGDTVRSGDELVLLDRRALELQVQQAEQGVKAAKAAVTNAEDDEDATKADVTAAKARQAQAEAAVELATLQLGFATVTAPRDGQVVSLTTNTGQNAAPGRALLTLSDPSDVFVRVFVGEPRIGEVKVGQPVTITSPSLDAEVAGTVSFVAAEAEFTPNTVQTEDQRTTLVFEVRIRVDDPDTLRAGMPADVAFG